jgi:hypothetical protein
MFFKASAQTGCRAISVTIRVARWPVVESADHLEDLWAHGSI